MICAIGVLVAAMKVEMFGLAADAPSRYTSPGWVQGKQVTVLGSTVVNMFFGVPFAASFLGPLRFAAPEPALPWKTFRDATSYPNSVPWAAWCLQNLALTWLNTDQHLLKVHYPKFTASEDCPYLNIYVPAHAVRGSNLPVMVWFPGGAFETGSASIFDGSALAAYEDVLVVTTQYRLGILDFNTGDQHVPGNWAFLDQVAALMWVQENIEFFGGNPDSVTIFIESAGAISVLVLSPMASDLFHKAIMKASESEINQDLQFIARICDCNESGSMALLQCLRVKSSGELLNLSQHIPGESVYLLVDEYFRNQNSVVEIRNSFLDLLGDVFFVVPGLLTAHYHRDAGGPVYWMFQHRPECFKYTKPTFIKVEHTDEICFVFGGAFLKGNVVMFERVTEEKLLNRKMTQYWAKLAPTGNPNGKDLPLWLAYNQVE
ncbi:LOW QUALITY PROTEIN: carboxylesterase 5A [Rhynchocyon petersi]